MEVESLGGSRYFLTFIDDASRKVWVYILNTKDQVFEYFKSFHVIVERETGKKLKCLRSDNGGEYTSKEFDAYCRTYGIRHEKPSSARHRCDCRRASLQRRDQPNNRFLLPVNSHAPERHREQPAKVSPVATSIIADVNSRAYQRTSIFGEANHQFPASRNQGDGAVLRIAGRTNLRPASSNLSRQTKDPRSDRGAVLESHQLPASQTRAPRDRGAVESSSPSGA
ncbi:Unknown protein [Striga hermonthica]|uniref:Integrase catalytic domain-containing protein n=1 Tax=Striga hermonthica TaxID=68872 RepID=A0A9N7RKH9_STRHE|nr:Unknown protein [Striga hermonthica]